MAEKVLMTGFTPFGSKKENPSQMVVEAFDDTSCGVEVVKAILPVSFAKAGKMIVDFIEDVRPDVVICLEQAGGRNEPSIERIAVNLNDSHKADNDGDIPAERVIVSGGASAYFSSLPIKDIEKNIKTSGLPATVSNTAGLFVCNLFGLTPCVGPRFGNESRIYPSALSSAASHRQKRQAIHES